MIARLVDDLKRNLDRGIAPAIRIATTMNEWATQAQMVEAGKQVKLNASTVRIQYNKARREDAAVERLCK